MNSDWTISRRSILAASIFIPGIVPRALAQESRGTTPTAGVQTTAGKVRGLARYGVNQFYGVRYGASTAGANRFMPPVKPASWTGVKDTVEWGEEAPQGPHTEIPEVASTIPKLTVGEDCLALNVWTNSLSGKR